jgi:hypothetical protein
MLKTYRSISSISTRLATLLVAMLLVSFTFLTPASAVETGCKGSPGITTYYGDATRTTIVGNYFAGCNGGCNGSGQITKWYRFDHYICVD